MRAEPAFLELSDELNLANVCESCSELLIEMLNCCFACFTCQSARKDASKEVKLHLQDKERYKRRKSVDKIDEKVPITEDPRTYGSALHLRLISSRLF